MITAKEALQLSTAHDPKVERVKSYLKELEAHIKVHAGKGHRTCYKPIPYDISTLVSTELQLLSYRVRVEEGSSFYQLEVSW